MTAERGAGTVWQLGAAPIDGATRFEVWAPNASMVELRIEPPAGDGEPIAMDRAAGPTGSGSDTWRAEVAGVGGGARYTFRLDRGDDWLADPASRCQPDGVHGPSMVVDPRAFRWTDDGWRGIPLADAVLYELHVGTFTPEGTLRAVIGELPRLAELGITHVELMPLSAFPGVRNWGYDGVFPHAVQSSYGGPAALAELVDAAHAHGIGVILDVVYNHFGPEGSVVHRYAPYLTDAYTTPWGAAVNVADRDSDPVRRYFVESAVRWVDDFHVDGLRLDAVHAIVDPTAIPFVEELTAAVHAAADRAGRTVLVTIESASNDPRIVRDRAHHGWGCDAVWDDDVHHALRVALTGERHEYYAGYDGVADLARAWRDRYVYTGQHSPVMGRRHGAPAGDVDRHRFIAFSQNHDHVGNTPGGQRLLSGAADRLPRLRLAAAAILLSPFTPLLFMGEEYAETAPFPYFVDHSDPALVEAVRRGRAAEFAGHDWSGEAADPANPEAYRAAILDTSLARDEPHRSMLAMFTDLLRLRRSTPTLMDPGAEQHVSVDGAVMTVTRATAGTELWLALNFGADPAVVGCAGAVVFDSDDARWGGWNPSPNAATRLAPWSARLVTPT